MSNRIDEFGQLLRAVIYPDSDDESSPLGNGFDGVYDRVEHKYNRQGQIKETKDQNETVHAFDFDKLGRQIQDRVTALGTNIDGAVRRLGRTFEVRGLLEKATSYDNATVGSGSVVNEVQRAYNAFQQLTAEYQAHGGTVNTSTTPKVEYGYSDGSANYIRPTTMTYPNGRVLTYGYGSNGSTSDNLSRVAGIIDGDVGLTHLADYTYLGLGSFVQVDYTEPDLRMDLAHGAGSDPYDGLDRFGRVVDLLWRNYGASTDVERVKHGYDRASNRLWRENPVAKSQSTPVYQDELYAYDGLYQLNRMDRGQLNGTKDGLVGGTLAFAQQWGLDATGNWNYFREDADGNSSWELDQPRSHNKANEITWVGADAGPDWSDPAHDRAGNMTTIPQPAAPTSSYAATWDAWNRLVKLMDGGSTVGEYAYDPLFRRTKKLVSSITRHFYYSRRWQVLEERIGSSSNPDRQFVWGRRYIDDQVFRDRDTNADGSLDERLYSLQDPNWNVTAIANASGGTLERYRYSAYGRAAVLTGTFESRASSLYEWETALASYRRDAESGLLQVRYRMLDSGLGRLSLRDFIGYRDGTNLYRYVRNRPTNGLDPSGTITCCGNDPQAANRCIRIYIFKRGPGSMVLGHAAVGLDFNGPTYGFHKSGITTDLAFDEEGNVVGVMSDWELDFVHKCCCFTQKGYDDVRQRLNLAQRRAKRNDDGDSSNNDVTDLWSQTYSAGGVLLRRPGPLVSPIATCSGFAAAVAAGQGCDPIEWWQGETPSTLHFHLDRNPSCERVSSGYTSITAARAKRRGKVPVLDSEVIDSDSVAQPPDLGVPYERGEIGTPVFTVGE